MFFLQAEAIPVLAGYKVSSKSVPKQNKTKQNKNKEKEKIKKKLFKKKNRRNRENVITKENGVERRGS